jgi:hypothetical protein
MDTMSCANVSKCIAELAWRRYDHGKQAGGERAVEGPKQRPTAKRWKPHSGEMGRVVDLREWKRKRRLRQAGRGRPALKVVFMIALIMLAVTAVSALGGCVPWWRQTDCILLAWLSGLAGLGTSLVLQAYRHHQAGRLMTGYLCCLAMSFAAALVKVVFASH